jgi:hypothetical protein
MSYFRNFPDVFYKFGNEASAELVQDIALYVDVIDQLKDEVSVYADYYIQENERPDQVSYKLYETPHHHWTFFMMNDHIRESGWPLTNTKIIEKAKKIYRHTTITTRTRLYDKFKVGQIIEGINTGATATINHRHLDLGQLVISDVTGTFAAGEQVTSLNEFGNTELITIQSTAAEYNSAHHYTNTSNLIVDIDPAVGPGAQLTEVTYLDRLMSQNDSLKQIRVIRPTAIDQVISAFREALRL